LFLTHPYGQAKKGKSTPMVLPFFQARFGCSIWFAFKLTMKSNAIQAMVEGMALAFDKANLSLIFSLVCGK
jgi:hypothetical protein